MPRTYTVDEARRALPEVAAILSALVRSATNLPELQDEARVAAYVASRDGAGAAAQDRRTRAEAAVALAEQDIVRRVRELDGMGVQLKDLRTGLVDFLSYRDGELVELCWRLGEKTLAHWHRVGEGFARRKPL